MLRRPRARSSPEESWEEPEQAWPGANELIKHSEDCEFVSVRLTRRAERKNHQRVNTEAGQGLALHDG